MDELDKLIDKHFGKIMNHNAASVRYYLETGDISGSFRMSLRHMLRDASSINTSDRDVKVITSKDYKRLFEIICKGLIVPCFVDYDWNDGSKSRDIARVKRFKENSIQVGARGIQYGGVEEFSLHGKTEFEAFVKECERMNLEYCC